MIDERFNLTPIDARNWEFGSKMRGYDPTRVEQFRERAAEELERLVRANQDLETKARGFHEQLRAFRERDKALNEALVSAQQLRSDIRESAEREAGLIVREARVDADRILESARNEAVRIQADVDALERSRRVYLAQLRAMVERQLAEIDAAREPVRGATVTPERATSTVAHEPPRIATPVAMPSFTDDGALENPARWAEGLAEE